MNSKFHFIAAVLLAVLAFSSCNEIETYAEQKEHERNCINDLVSNGTTATNGPIKVISESEFEAKGQTTDVSKNEYVLFESNGVYMQIIEKGCGNKLQKGESATVLCRFNEYNINQGTVLINTNNYIGNGVNLTDVDKMTVKNTSGTFSASFESGAMKIRYGSSQVPAGWLVPLSYINIGRPASEGDEIAHVRLIVPHDKGQAYATSGVYACLYDITYMKGID